jgi:hypothetical protein
MITRPNLRLSLLTAALAASAATAWAAMENNSTYVPAYQQTTVTTTTTTALEPQPVVAIEEPAIVGNEAAILSDGPAVSAKESDTTYLEAVRRAESEPPIEVTKPRLTVDQRIQADVMDVLARSPNLSGKIGVVSEDSVVTLTGYTATSGQAWRAGSYARSVVGVRHVVNEIRPRVGGITS